MSKKSTTVKRSTGWSLTTRAQRKKKGSRGKRNKAEHKFVNLAGEKGGKVSDKKGFFRNWGKIQINPGKIPGKRLKSGGRPRVRDKGQSP